MEPLKHKAGDKVRVIKADAYPELIGREVEVMYVGPWKAGDEHPTGNWCIYDNDYMISIPEDLIASGLFDEFDKALAVREGNLEAV